MREVAIVHYNTPELTEAAILSLRKHGGGDYHVTVFDNSDSRPFTKEMDGVTRIDNTLGQIVDFDDELAKYPDKDWRMGCGGGGSWGSAKHLMSVQALWDILPDGFLLMDSDVLIKGNVEFMFRDDLCTVGHIQTWEQSGNRGKVDRLVPMVLWINVPLCTAGGARFFDPARAWALSAGGNSNPRNWYDTGASFYEDIRTKKPACRGMGIDIRPLMVHYQGASWRKVLLQSQLSWLHSFAKYWKPSPDYVLGDPDWQRPVNRGAKIYIAAHKAFPMVTNNPIYQVEDARCPSGHGATFAPEGDVRRDAPTLDEWNGTPGAFFSELLVMQRVAQQKKLPAIVGWCGYRKYFSFGSNVPNLSWYLKKYGCIVSQYVDLGMPMRDHYARIVGNVDDLDIVTQIVTELYPEFLEAWLAALEKPLLHPASMFVMRCGNYREMLSLVWDVVCRYLERIGGDIVARVRSNPGAYHLPGSTEAYQIRVGGQLCERLISAWIDWKWPGAKQWSMIVV